MPNELKICPICVAGGNQHCNAFCKGQECMWYVADRETCAIAILAEEALERRANDEQAD